jgi:hypothetical protein
MSLKRVANDRFSAVNSLRPLSGSGRSETDAGSVTAIRRESTHSCRSRLGRCRAS